MGQGSHPMLRDQVATGTCVWQWVKDHSNPESTLGDVQQMADELGENWHGCGKDFDSEADAPVQGNEADAPVQGNEADANNP